MPEVGEGVLEPVVDVVEAELPVLGVHDGLADQRRVSERGTDVVQLVKLLVLNDF